MRARVVGIANGCWAGRRDGRWLVGRWLDRRGALGQAGFTLIEILIVIVILAILIAFLVPAISGAQQTARIAQVRMDISTLESAIAKFRQDFQVDPPSSIILFENGGNTNGWNLPANASDPDVVRSRSLLRQMWPQYDFNNATGFDLNYDGDTDDRIVLGGAECLVFFLGGVSRLDDTNGNSRRDLGESLIPAGFSRNPQNPFSTAAAAMSGNRQGPYFEFVPTRLLESPVNATFFTYLDTLPGQSRPYVYVSSYGGKGYRRDDLGTGGLQHWYLQGSSATSPAWNATKYQIISPGPDKEYGVGGPFTPSGTTALPGWTRTSPAAAFTAADRDPEKDNITNFHSSLLSRK